ncbi:MAG: hypothetical protein WA081_21410 [Desulfosalsimonadaceae bacterium]
MKIQNNILLLLIIFILIPTRYLYADECDDYYEKARENIDSAQEATNEKDYESAAGYYEKAAEYFEKIAETGNCRCPKIERAAQSNADKYNEKAKQCIKWEREQGLYEEYHRAVEICTEGHSCARNRNYVDAIEKFEEAAEIWDEIGTETDSQYSQKAITEANTAREAADHARKYIEREEEEEEEEEGATE